MTANPPAGPGIGRRGVSGAVLAGGASRREPLVAVYRRRCLPIVEALLARAELRLGGLLDRLTLLAIGPDEWRQLDPDGLSLVNLDAPEDVARLAAVPAGAPPRSRGAAKEPA